MTVSIFADKFKERLTKPSVNVGLEKIKELPRLSQIVSAAKTATPAVGMGFVKAVAKDVVKYGVEKAPFFERFARRQVDQIKLRPIREIFSGDLLAGQEREKQRKLDVEKKYASTTAWAKNISHEIDKLHITKEGTPTKVGETIGEMGWELKKFLAPFGAIKTMQVAQLQKAGKLERASALLKGSLKEEIAPSFLAGIPLAIEDSETFEDFAKNMAIYTAFDVGVLGASKILKPIFVGLKPLKNVTPQDVVRETKRIAGNLADEAEVAIARSKFEAGEQLTNREAAMLAGGDVLNRLKQAQDELNILNRKADLTTSEKGIKNLLKKKEMLENEIESLKTKEVSIKDAVKDEEAFGIKLLDDDGNEFLPIKEMNNREYLVLTKEGKEEVRTLKNPKYAIDPKGLKSTRDYTQSGQTMEEAKQAFLQQAKGGLKDLEPLAKEAKKYKSADEFVKARINDLNPTSGVFVKYTPKTRATANLGENITTLDKTLGGSPTDTITVYRGTREKKIVAGDFVTTNKQLAKDYAGTGNVVELKVKKGDVLDDITEPLGEEYIYRPNAFQENLKTKSQLTDIFNKAKELEQTPKTVPKLKQEQEALTKEYDELARKGELSTPRAEEVTARDSEITNLLREEDPSFLKYQEEALQEARNEAKEFLPSELVDSNESANSLAGFLKNNETEIKKLFGLKGRGGGILTDFLESKDLPSIEKLIREAGDSDIKRSLSGELNSLKANTDELSDETFQNAIQLSKKVKRERTALEILATQKRVEKYAPYKEKFDKRIKKIKDKAEIVRNRRRQISDIQKYFGLSDFSMRKAGGKKDVRFMTDFEYKKFKDKLAIQAEKEYNRMVVYNQVISQIQEKELKKVENLQRAMQLPSTKNMTIAELRSFDEALEFTKHGDEFLSPRKLETVANTDLAGIKTLREAKERLAEQLGVSVEELGKIKSDKLDWVRYDTALAEKNPFYKLLVDEKNMKELEATARFLDIEKNINNLIKKARKSKKQGITDKLVPQDEKIMNYLEAKDKAEIALTMTKEELKAAEYIRNVYAEMRDYLIQHRTLEKFRENYFTHRRMGFLESLKTEGLRSSVKNVFKQQKEEQAVFNILAGDTNNILPLEKFFQYSLKRTGALQPSKNVAKSVIEYTRAFEQKRALDAILPKFDIYVQALTPTKKTPRGLEYDRSLKQFYNTWMNAKKGRKFDFGGVVPQGGIIDITLRGLRGLTSLLDLGFSLPIGIATKAGENITNFVMLGTKKYNLGLLRSFTKQGKKIISENLNFVGKNPWGELVEASKDIGDKFGEISFIAFRDAQVRANKTFLMGSLTKEEYKTGIITTKRLAELKTEMGRFRVVDNAKAILGNTSVGGVFTQYKTWAIPIIRTSAKNLTTVLKTRNFKSRESQELVRGALATASIALIIRGVMSEKRTEKEKTFVEKVIDKTARDALSLVGALNPNMWTGEFRQISFIRNIIKALDQIVKLEEYKSSGKDYKKGDLKGLKKLKRDFTPSVLKQFETTGKKKRPTRKTNTDTRPPLESFF